MKPKQRLSASVDSDLIRAATNAARRGEVPTVSAWVNEALRLKLEHDERLRALDAFIEVYEAEHGVITREEMEAATRKMRSRAVPVRALSPQPRVKRSRSSK
jgi:Arc/MetJ-type ribon-helix-helix transcriptional regulator